MKNKKTYYSFSNYVKNKFGVKVGKISIDTDFGCAHKANNGGCRFCNLNSYKPPYVIEENIESQWSNGVKNYRNRYQKFYAYFQLGTPLSPLASKESLMYANKLIHFEDCVGLMFGARSDMLEENVLKELNDLSASFNKEIWLEMLRARNDMTHIYNGEAAKQMVSLILERYIPAFAVMEERIRKDYGEILKDL